MTKQKNIVEEAKAAVRAKEGPKKPWYIIWLVNFLDFVSIVAILTLALVGVLSLLDSDISKEVAIGISAGIVLLLSARCIERVWQPRG